VVGLLFGSLAVTLGLADLDAVTDEPTNRKSAMAAVVLGIVAIVIGLAAPVFRIWLIV
jgi:putative effector of murein hydrolase